MKITLPTFQVETKNLFMVTPDTGYTYFSYSCDKPLRGGGEHQQFGNAGAHVQGDRLWRRRLLDQSRRAQPQLVFHRVGHTASGPAKPHAGHRDLSPHLAEVGGPRETGINLGLIWDLSDTQHTVLSAGPAIEGSNQLQGYFAYELTFGP
jgi:hypothetical protein